jgi:hypothetical protein
MFHQMGFTLFRKFSLVQKWVQGMESSAVNAMDCGPLSLAFLRMAETPVNAISEDYVTGSKKRNRQLLIPGQ